MSPRPTNSEGKRSLLAKIGSKQSTHLPVAMLARSTTSQEAPDSGRTLQRLSELAFTYSYRDADKFPKFINCEPSFRRKQSTGWRIVCTPATAPGAKLCP
jgi:hypothetical protein